MNEQIFAMPQPNPQPTPEAQEEFLLLMSLRLDNLLDSAEEQQFQEMVRAYPVCARAWARWQRVHQQLVDEPSVAPPVNFAQSVEACLLQQERRGRLWQGLLIGLLVVVMWCAVVTIALGLGAYILFNQSNLLGDLIRNLAFVSSLVAQWVATVQRAFNSFAATPQATALAIGYVALAVIALSAWIRFLRGATEVVEVTEPLTLSLS